MLGASIASNGEQTTVHTCHPSVNWRRLFILPPMVHIYYTACLESWGYSICTTSKQRCSKGSQSWCSACWTTSYPLTLYFLCDNQYHRVIPTASYFPEEETNAASIQNKHCTEILADFALLVRMWLLGYLKELTLLIGHQAAMHFVPTINTPTNQPLWVTMYG